MKLHTKVVTRAERVSAAQIRAYYRTHASEFRRNGQRQALSAATPAILQTLLQSSRERHFAAFLTAYQQRWKARTACQPGYVVAKCRNGPALAAH